MNKNRYYFDLSYGGQLLIWSSRLYISDYRNYNRNTEDIIIRVYNKLNINNGYVILADFLSLILDNHLLVMNDINNKILNNDEYLISEFFEDLKYRNIFLKKYNKWGVVGYLEKIKFAAKRLLYEFESKELSIYNNIHKKTPEVLYNERNINFGNFKVTSKTNMYI